MPPSKVTPEMIKRIIQLREQGCTWHTISQRFELSLSTLYKAIKDSKNDQH